MARKGASGEGVAVVAEHGVAAPSAPAAVTGISRWWWVLILLAVLFAVAATVQFNLSRSAAEKLVSATVLRQQQQLSQSLVTRLEGNRDYLELLASGISRGTVDAVAFQTQASEYVSHHPGLNNINFSDAGYVIRWAAPYATNKQVVGLELLIPEPKRAAHAAAKSRKPAYTRAFTVVQGFPAFEVYVPVYDGSRFRGTLSGIYDLHGLLRASVPPDALSGARFELIDGAGQTVSAIGLSSADANGVSVTKSFGLPDSDLSVRVSEPSITSVVAPLQLILSLSIALSISIVASMSMLYVGAVRREQIAQTLRDSETRFATLFHASPAGTAMTRMSDQVMVDVNTAWESLVGYSRDEVVGRSADELDLWPDEEQRHQLLEALIDNPTARAEVRIRRKTGEVRDMLMSAHTIQIAGEGYMLTSAQDVTEIREAESKVRGFNAALERLVAERTSELSASNIALKDMNLALNVATSARSLFLSSMSHELRTPLNSIIGFSGILLQGLAGELNEEERKQVAMINNSGRHLLELVNGVLDLGKIEAGLTQPSIRSADLSDIAREAVDTIRSLAEPKGIEVRWECPEHLAPVPTDSLFVSQILLNLLGNAVKCTDRGFISTVVSQDASGVTIQVEDSGCGIATEEMDHIFEDFYQVIPLEGGKREGTGLGLTISRHLAASIGASIEVTSDPTLGSVFTLHIPSEWTPAHASPVGDGDVDGEQLRLVDAPEIPPGSGAAT